ncbi:glycosyltransferase family 4 protein [Microbacterium suaedae]|uniref:glycosyltransferase family 4 protein n=1 Tax=Microbacterium suaedae TaxID=2067813 RepID=UPI000DA245AC|nr:glycosyltransferase family 4 protein [Microbacterium suaedae]
MSTSNPPLLVAHVAHTTERGGAEIALARLLSHPARAWQARLALPTDSSLGVFAGLDDVDISRAGRPQRPGAASASPIAATRFAGALVRQAGALRRSGALHGADVVHANSTRAAAYAALALRGRTTPLIVHLRDRIERDAIGSAGALLFRRVVVPRATGFVANSASTARTVSPLARADQFVEVVPSPIGMSRAVHSAPRPDGPVRIGMVARLSPWKGQEELLRAFARAGLSGRATLTLVGGTSFGSEEFARRLAGLARELGVAGDVTFAGHEDEVRGRIDALDVCVQYSTRPEPLGQNVLQYLARGRTVVASNEGGPAEWIRDGENGVLVPPRDVAALAKALRRLVDDAALRGRLADAARTDERIPSDETIVRAHERVFARAAGRH